ncbi:hypothetical protein GCM10028833_40130 [Glycomyces tarimensis]
MASIEDLAARIRAARETIGEVGGGLAHSRSKAAELQRQFKALGAEDKSGQVAKIDLQVEEQQARVAQIVRDAETAQAQADALRRGEATGAIGSAGPAPAVPVVVQGPAGNGIRPPHANRHLLTRISDQSRAKAQNTVILPAVDVDADLESIRNGRARWHPSTGRYEINGRFWGVKANGTVFPESGEGFERLTRNQYKALKALVECGGDMERRPKELARDPRISAADWTRAASVHRYHPQNARGKS